MEEGDDKCVTSDLLKDIPLMGVLSGNGGVSLPIEPELVKEEPLPPPKEVGNGNIKTVTDYREEEDGHKVKLSFSSEPVQAQQNKTGKYVPPNRRDGACCREESMQRNCRADDNATIRVTILSRDTRETDLKELFRPFGSISRIYLPKDKTTDQFKGFAFIKFHHHEDAARAIAGMSTFGHDQLILNVQWAK